MTPTEIREALRAVVEAGQGASRGEWRVVPRRYEVESVEGMVAGGIGRGDGHFIVAAANARPALASVAGKVWLEPGDLRHLLGKCDCRRQWMGGIREGSWPPKHTDAIAAAEAEMRAIAEVL